MAFVPDAKQRTEEGAQKHGHRLEDLERGGRRTRVTSGRPASGGLDDGCGQPWRSS